MGHIKRILTARGIALDILRRVETEQSYAANLLASNVVDQLSPPDRRLTYELVLGVLRWQLQLDYLIEKLSNRSIKKLDLTVLLALRLGLYQIRFLSRIPQSAAVNESVEIVKRSGFQSASGFVNALLRRAGKESDHQMEALNSDKIGDLAIILSHPHWLIEKWIAQLGIESAKKLASANNEPPPTTFRLNHLKADIEKTREKLIERGIEFVPGSLASGAYRIDRGSAGDLKDLTESGAIYFQDEASQLVAELVSAKPGGTILDLCSAPGSKTTQLAADMNNTGVIIAGDIHPRRLVSLKRACNLLGVTNTHAIAFDATNPLPIRTGMEFDSVLVDAPCSGTGTLRHNPEIKWRLTPQRIVELASLQSQVLDNASKYVRGGGQLVYSTCSIETEENEKVILDLLASHPEFEIVRPNLMETAESAITSEGFVRTFPQAMGSDGFFAVVLRKAL